MYYYNKLFQLYNSICFIIKINLGKIRITFFSLIQTTCPDLLQFKMASSETTDESLYPIAVLIDELRNEDVQVYYNYSNSFQIENAFLRTRNKNIFEHSFYFKLDLKLVCLI